MCCEKYNKSTRMTVACGFCPLVACRKCVKTYLLDSIRQPHCMSCKKPWTFEKIAHHFPKSFWHGEFRDYQEKLLLERERAILPETQRELYEEGQRKIFAALQYSRNAARDEKLTVLEEGIVKMMQPIAEELGIDVDTNIYNIDRKTRTRVASNYTALCNCPKEGCRGFIQLSNYTCGLCDTRICKKCQVEMKNSEAEQHVCKDDDIETTKLLKKDTKACPGCNTLIYKIDGCDQMWCIVCKKAFSWKTGEIEQRIHNPHFYEWMRTHGREIPREPGDNPCEDFHRDIRMLIRVLDGRWAEHQKTTLMNLHRALNHNEAMRGTFTIHQQTEASFLRKLRVDYLRNEISEEEWKRELVLRERQNERKRALSQIFELFQQRSTEIINSFTTETTKENIADAIKEVRALVEYCNECFMKITKFYNIVPYVISSIHFDLRRDRPNADPFFR